MESNMVKSNYNIELVKTYFSENLQNYSIVEEFFHGPYWGIKFSNKDIDIRIFGDIGFAIEVFIDNYMYDLWEYDKSVNNAMKTTDQNILYQLDVLKRFLSSEV